MYPYKLEAIIFVCFHHVISQNSFAFTLNSLITSVDYLLPDFIAFEVRSSSLRSLKSGFHMNTERFFLSDRSDHSNRSDHMETVLNLSQ